MKVEDWLGKDNTLGIDIWTKKYRYGNESFDEWLDRISNGYADVKEYILNKKFLFGGRILANRGLDKKGIKVTYSNCYVVTPPEDSIKSIYETAYKMAETYKYGGGCGVNLKGLAPKNATVNNTAKTTSGAVSWIDLFDLTTSLIGQNGRRGALMVSMPCTHPDIEEFAKLKTDLDKATKCNLSIMMDDDFMDKVVKGEFVTNAFYRPETDCKIEKTIDCKKFFDDVAKYNYDYGEPGMLFWDRIKNWCINSNNREYEFAGTNPCSEQPLPSGGSCLLGSINLSEFVTDTGTFDFEDFERCVKVSVVALNHVLDEGQPLHPLQEQRDSVAKWKQIGLGIMGLADMLFKMGIAYGSNESIELCDQIADLMINSALRESSRLASVLGVCNGYTDAVLESDFIKYNADASTIKAIREHGLRNTQLLTIAPTGTIATMLGINGGIEPFFATHYTRTTKTLDGKEKTYDAYIPTIKSYMDSHDGQLPEYTVTAGNLDYLKRIEMQSIWQKHIDASISSTINLPHDFPMEKVKDIYLTAWRMGLKGVTVFRDGCKREGILKTDKVNDSELVGKKRKLVTGCGNLHVSGFFDNGQLKEVFVSRGSTGGCTNTLNGLSRMISLSLRNGVPVDRIIDQLDSCGVCPSYAVRNAKNHDCSKGSCCPMAIGNALMEMCEINRPSTSKSAKCPQCGEPMIAENGCIICKSCGYSKCD